MGLPAPGLSRLRRGGRRQAAGLQAEELGHVRVEACDTCRRYIKTIDMTKNGSAVPVVDELAAAPLDLWASEHGYSKLQPNILGL